MKKPLTPPFVGQRFQHYEGGLYEVYATGDRISYRPVFVAGQQHPKPMGTSCSCTPGYWQEMRLDVHRSRCPVHSRVHRSFRSTHPCPATGRTKGACPGYVIDHVRPLKRGGPDAPSNMQWQTKAAAKAKDKTE